MTSNTKWIAGIVGAAIVAALFIVWLVYFNTPALTPDVTQTQFGTADARNTANISPEEEANAQLPVTQGDTSAQKVFKIAEGPIAGAVLIDTVRPTSTVARFIMQTNGHAFDLVLDSPGAVPKTISNTTVPGIAKVLWGEGGRGALLQYVDQDITVKTTHISLPAPASTTPAVRIQFLPSGILSVAVSPDGKSAAYLLKTSAGADLYTATLNGGGAKKLASFPLSQLLLSWPAQGTLLVQTPSAQNVPGVMFSIDAKSGIAAPLLYAPGLSAMADRSFNKVIYQTASESRSTYVYTVKTGLAQPLSFAPAPELCIWGLASAAELYCPAPRAFTGADYLDQLHLGAAAFSTSIFKFNTDTGQSKTIATPGSGDGGVESDIAELSISQSEKYLLFIRRGDRSLWAVRLGE